MRTRHWLVVGLVVMRFMFGHAALASDSPATIAIVVDGTKSAAVRGTHSSPRHVTPCPVAFVHAATAPSVAPRFVQIRERRGDVGWIPGPFRPPTV